VKYNNRKCFQGSVRVIEWLDLQIVYKVLMHLQLFM